jgi:uracil DNA glycosylase
MQEIIRKINDKLKEGQWYDELRIFLESSDFSDIFVELKKKVDIDKQRFCPSLATAFRFMEDVPVNKIKAVLFIDYVPNKLEYSTGMVLSNKGRHCEYIISEFLRSSTIKSPDPEKWVQQGLLVLPMSVTCRIDGKPHTKLWHPFVIRIIELINKTQPHVPWVLIGKDTWEYEENILSNHIRKTDFKLPFKDREWTQWINSVLISQKKQPVIWHN